MTKRYLDHILEDTIGQQLFLEQEVSRLQCPNCDRYTLIPKTKHELSCSKCGHEFIIVDKSVRFK